MTNVSHRSPNSIGSAELEALKLFIHCTASGHYYSSINLSMEASSRASYSEVIAARRSLLARCKIAWVVMARASNVRDSIRNGVA